MGNNAMWFKVCLTKIYSIADIQIKFLEAKAVISRYRT